MQGQKPRPRKPSEYIAARNEGKPYILNLYDSPPPLEILGLVLDKEQALKGCDVPLDRPIFQAEPSDITFQGFQPFKTYELVVNFRNIDKVIDRLQRWPVRFGLSHKKAPISR